MNSCKFLLIRLGLIKTNLEGMMDIGDDGVWRNPRGGIKVVKSGTAGGKGMRPKLTE
jgi:hypothetical protein